MSSSEHVIDALLDGGAPLEDPIRMAAVLEELRSERPEPAPALRARVAERLAAPAAPPRRARRRPLVAAGGLAALAVCAVGAAALWPAGSSTPPLVARDSASVPLELAPSSAAGNGSASPSVKALPATTGGAASPSHLTAVAPASGRLQDYQAWMALRVTTTARLSQVAQRSISLTRGFGGYVTRSDVNVRGAKDGTAVVDVHIPIARVQEAIDRFSSLGVIIGQHVAVADLQAGYDAAARRAESLRHSLALIEIRLADPKVGPEQRVALLGQRERARHALADAQETTAGLSARGAYARLDLSFSTGAKAAGRRRAR